MLGKLGDKSESRIRNASLNAVVSIVTQVTILIVSFVCRTFFIKVLGAEYLGIDGLFSSILTILSLAELGFGSAIIFDLYKPIAEGNIAKARQFITLYATVYRIVMIAVSVVGLALMPFLPSIINLDKLSVDVNIYFVYILFLANTVSTYFLASYQSILIVNQLQREVSSIQLEMKLVVTSLECLVLFFFKDYYAYLTVKVVGNFVQVYLIKVRANKKFPELCVRSDEKLTKRELSKIWNNVGALFIRRIGSVVLSSTDNIIINTFISTVMVGVYSNYVLIVSSVKTITGQIFSSVTASIGNYIATQNNRETEALFRFYSFMTYLIYGFCGICIFTLANRFISLLWGDDYLLSIWVVFVIVVDFFLQGFTFSIIYFRDAAGFFVQGRFRPVFSAVINIVLSILLIKPLGVVGVILATVISRLLVSAWYDPYILYKNLFKTNVWRYYGIVALYTLIVLALCLLSYRLTLQFSNTFIGLVLSLGVSILISIFLLFPFIKSEELSLLKYYLKRVIHS